MRGQEPRVQPPAFEAFSDLPLFNTKAVVHQTGVPAPTLRAWERRYGILTPQRGGNDYRLYSERDIVTVTWLRERVQSGMTISQAIALLKSLEPARRRARRVARADHAELSTPGPANGNSPPATAPAALVRVSVDDAGAALLRHLAALDEPAARFDIAQVMAVYSVEDVCLHFLAPVLEEIGRLWAAGQLSVAVEHFSANIVRAQLESLFRAVGDTETGPLVLVGCAPGELHEIGSLMLALFLRRAGLRVAYLGQSVEVESMLEIAASVRPAVVLLSASLRNQTEALAELGRKFDALNGARPLFGFGGRAFASDPTLAEQIPGDFLGSDALEATRFVKKRLST
jgi:MerR family transcriptional regulator, light-induced transcriptional regulator